jgi:hypothetical protein
MSHQQAEKLTNAIRWVGNNKNDVISAFKFIAQGIGMIFK